MRNAPKKKLDTSLGQWPEDWPPLMAVVGFWHFGLGRKGLLPQPGVKIEAWARSLNLVDEQGAVPPWVLAAGSNPMLLQDQISRVHDTNTFYFPNPPKGPSRGVGDILHAMQLGLSIEKTWALAQSEFRWDVAVERRHEARDRILKALTVWVDEQLSACEALYGRSSRIILGDGLTQEKINAFVDFQCRKITVRKMAEGHIGGEDRERVLRNQLSRYARTLGLQLRRDRAGRKPKRNTDPRRK